MADANERRDPILFEELTRALMAQAGNAIRKERRELLSLIDATTIGLHSPAAETARLYKQHLKIKTFLGESENAVSIQLLTALIAYLLVVIHTAAGALKDSLWEILTELRTGLFLRVQEEQDRWRRRRHRQAVFDARQRGLFA